VLTSVVAVSGLSGISAQELCAGPGALSCKDGSSCSIISHDDSAIGYCTPKHQQCLATEPHACPIGFKCSPGALVTHPTTPKGLCVLAAEIPRVRLAQYIADCCNTVAFNSRSKFGDDSCLVYPTDDDERSYCGIFLNAAEKKTRFVPTPAQIDACCGSASDSANQSGSRFNSPSCKAFGDDADFLCAPYVEQDSSGQQRLPKSRGPRKLARVAAADDAVFDPVDEEIDSTNHRNRRVLKGISKLIGSIDRLLEEQFGSWEQYENEN